VRPEVTRGGGWRDGAEEDGGRPWRRMAARAEVLHELGVARRRRC
jgi:hypothetical protein